MNNDLPPEEEGRLLQFIASTVESTRDRVNLLYESMATKDEVKAQASAIRGDIEQVQLRLDTIEHALRRANGAD
jgi:hypothetical protein